jgi:uncharacterized membrane protein
VQPRGGQIAGGNTGRGARSLIAVSRTTAWQLGLATLGLLISAYLTATHYFAEQVPLACSTGGIVDCEQVTTSAESMIGPIPVAVLGIVWFGVALAMVLARATRLQMAWAIFGLVSIFYLVYAELFLIGALCLWCTAIHVIVVVLFLMTLWEATAPSPARYEAT